MKRFFAVLMLAMLLTACSDSSRDPIIKDCRIQRVGSFGFGQDGLSADMKLDLDIENPSNAKYTIESLNATLFPKDGSTAYGYVTLKDIASITPKSDTTVAIPLSLKLTRPLSLLSGGLDGDFSDYVADIDLVIRKGALKKRIKKERMPLSEIAEMFGR